MIETLARLKQATFFRSAEWHGELASTNAAAMALAANDGEELPLLIGAARQTAGRGRGRNSWWSSDGALTFSLLFNPLAHGLPLERWSQTALMTGLAVADTLEQYLPPAAVQLKWPNDVYAHGRKICGILTEVPPGRSDRLVVGIGLNVGNSLADAPEEIRTNAVSLSDLLGTNCPSLEDVLCSLVAKWELWLQWLAADEIDFPTAWRAKCSLRDSLITVTVGPEVRSGVCLGLDADGALLIETDNGVERVIAGTVRKVDESP